MATTVLQDQTQQVLLRSQLELTVLETLPKEKRNETSQELWSLAIFPKWLSRQHHVHLVSERLTFDDVFFRQVLSVRVVCYDCFKIHIIEILFPNRRFLQLPLFKTEEMEKDRFRKPKWEQKAEKRKKEQEHCPSWITYSFIFFF